MKDVKAVVAENLTALRKARGLTQAQLAEKFNYSDKAICRWEHGDTLPDINTLYALAEFYGVTMNDLVDTSFEAIEAEEDSKTMFKYRLLISALLLAAVWLFIVVAFVMSVSFGSTYWIIFVWAVPISCFVLARFWRKQEMLPVLKISLYSVLNWSLITSLFLHFLFVNGINSWMLFLVGLPIQAIIIFWQQIKHYRNNL